MAPKKKDVKLENLVKLADTLQKTTQEAARMLSNYKNESWVSGSGSADGIIRMYDDSLKIRASSEGVIDIEGQRGLALEVTYLDKSDPTSLDMQLAPKDAVYRIRSCFSNQGSKEAIPGVIYLGSDGKVMGSGSPM